MNASDDSPTTEKERPIEPLETVSVKDAARTLETPTWRIYRMNRSEGPLRFVQRGRRVLVEIGSVNSYLRGLRRQDQPEISSDEETRGVLRPSSTAVEAQNDDRNVSENVEHSGQRELRPRQGWGPGVVMYISDWTPISS